jgi:negative regulator of genetic competence, sporulation and motility
MKFFIYLVTVLSFTIISCTIAKTDYDAEISTVVTEYYDFLEVVSIHTDDYKISIEALNGTFYKGYNEIHLTITDTLTGETIDNSAITFLPILTNSDESVASCPHQYNLDYITDDQYYSGYSVFTSESSTTENWKLYISFTANNKTYSIEQTITVEEQTNMNLNMTEFTGDDGEYYYIALISPQKPSVAENELIAGIYKYNQPTDVAGTFPDPSQYSYSKVTDYTLQIDPRMPEASMGNHSSINNEDLTQETDGLYYGVVNYTMTGNWTLNFIMLNAEGETLKGTTVSSDFTPGIEGTKSDLYIDILF